MALAHKYYTCLAVLAVTLLAQAIPVSAQQPRTRTLTYDSAQEDWVELPPPRPGTAEGDLHAIRVLVQDGKYGKALTAVQDFVKRHGESHALYPDVLIAKATALIGREDYDKAHLALQAFLAEFSGIELTAEALRLEFVVAETYLTGVKRRVFGIALLSGEDVAFQILDEITTDHPDSPLAELAIKTKADYLFAKGDHSLAEFEYGRLLRDYPQSRYHQFGLRRSAEAALAGFRGEEYAVNALVEAEERYHDYMLRYPGAADREDVRNILDTIRSTRAEKDYSIGAYYQRTGHLGSAIYYYRLVREHWPGTIAAAKAVSRLELLGALELESELEAETPTEPARPRDDRIEHSEAGNR